MSVSKKELARKNRRRGRRIENKLNDLLGMVRGGLYGGADGFDSHFTVEIKSRKTFVGQKFMDQSIKNNKNDKIPLYIVHITNNKYENAHVCIRLKDWLRLMEAIDWTKLKQS